MKIFIDDSDYPIADTTKRKIRKLSRFFYHKCFEYSMFVYANGRVSCYTDKLLSRCCFAPTGKVKIWLHNHPMAVCYPSLMDRIIARDNEVEIAGVYGRNQVKNRLEVYIFQSNK